MELIMALTIGVLFAVSVFQILRRNVIRSVLGLMLLANAVNLFLLSAGASSGDAPPYASEVGVRSDALPQALILTAIVISMAGTALMLALLTIISARYETSDMDDVNNLRH